MLVAQSFLLAALPALAAAFAPMIPLASNAFVASSTQLNAEGGPPKYDRRLASIVSNEEVGRGTYLIRVAPDDDEQGVDYKPGHVLALEIPNPDSNSGEGEQEGDDSKKEEEWMRGPYTVTRSNTKSFDVLYRVVGKKSKTLASAKIGSKVQFGGKFKVPILDGIDSQGLERVVLISTGVGVGPMIGFVEKALQLSNGESLFPSGEGKIELYAGFRDQEDVCCADTLDALAAAHPDTFSWTPVVSSKVGRTSDEKTLGRIAEGLSIVSPGSTHYHLIGNGSMVNEFKEGLEKAGVPEDRVTIEMYFNHKEPVRAERVDAISQALKEEVAVEAS